MTHLDNVVRECVWYTLTHLDNVVKECVWYTLTLNYDTSRQCCQGMCVVYTDLEQAWIVYEHDKGVHGDHLCHLVGLVEFEWR